MWYRCDNVRQAPVKDRTNWQTKLWHPHQSEVKSEYKQEIYFMHYFYSFAILSIAKTNTNVQREETDSSANQNTQKRTRRKTRTIQSLVRQPQFYKFELVWAYVKGYPYWPGVIEEETARGQFVVHFFGDYTRSNVSRNSVRHFFEGFEEYSSHDTNKKLPKAIQEARIMLLGNDDVDECLVCKIEKVKMQLKQTN